MTAGKTLAQLVAKGLHAYDTQAQAWSPAIWFEELRAATTAAAAPADFPPRIMAVLLEIARREGPGFDGAWTDGHGEPLRDDADAALQWIVHASDPTPSWAAASSYVCDFPECIARQCDWECNRALSPAEINQQAAAYRKLRGVPDHLLGAAGVPCIALPDSYEKGKYLSGADADSALGIKCLTCNGHEMIGGFQSGAAPGYVSEPCPECNTPAVALPAAALAEGRDRDGDSLEQSE